MRLTGSLASTLIDVHHSATFDVQALYALEPGNMLVGDGRVLGDLLVHGTVAPGASTGTLSICDITFAAGSALEIELGGTHWVLDYDRLISSGTISLQHGSTLDVTLVGWFPQEPGDIFDILDFSHLTGTFTTLNLPDLGPGLWWDTDALYTDGTLGVVPEPATLSLLALGGLALLLRRRK